MNERTGDGGCSCGYRAGSRPTQIGCGAVQCPFRPEDSEVQVHDHAVGEPDPEFGSCAYCPQNAVVKVNGTAVCIPHMNEKFVGIGETVRAIAAKVAALPEEEKA